MNRPDPPSVTPPGIRLLLVCSGNTCRSPMAEVVARRRAPEMGVPVAEVRSAGTSTLPGLPASSGARRAVERHGLSLEGHASTPISADLLRWADLVLVMGPSHLQRVRGMGTGSNASLLGAFAEGREEAEGGMDHLAVPDPFGGNDEVYEETFLLIEGLVVKALERLGDGESEGRDPTRNRGTEERR